jgi:hypothetical protein
MIRVLLLACAIAAAADDDERAKSLHEAGAQAYDKGRYLLAIDAFESAYRLSPRAATAFSLAQAQRVQYFVDGDLSRLERAVEMYRAYLDRDPTGTRREHATEHLTVLVPILERARAEEPKKEAAPAPVPAPKTRLIISSRTEGAHVKLDGGAPEIAPASFDVTPGPHRVEVAAPSFVSKTVETQAVEGTAVAFNVELDPLPGTIAVSAPENARINVDGRDIGAGPSARADFAAGWHVVSVLEAGKISYVRDLHVSSGEVVEVTAELETTAQRWAAYSLFAGAALFAAGTGVAAIAAVGKEQDAAAIDDKLGRMISVSVEETERYRALEDERDDLVRIATFTGTAAVVSATLGLILYLTDTPSPAPLAPRSSAGSVSAAIVF